MNTGLRLALVATLLSMSAGFASAHGEKEQAKPQKYDAGKVEVTEFGEEGDPQKVTRTIQIDMADTMRFTPASVSVKRGETIRFVVRNNGKAMHEMVLGTREAIKEHADLMKKFPEMEHADANMAHVKPGSKGEIIWLFTKTGEFQFACLQPGHFEAGMVGKVTVK